MKNKLFWPIVLISIVIIVESVLLLSSNQTRKTKVASAEITPPVEEVKVAEVLSFDWQGEVGKSVLIMTAKKAVAIDAIDLYIGYKNIKVNSVKNLEELPEPSFSKISADKSLVVMNYLISEAEGFKMQEGQSVKIVELGFTLNSTESAEFLIDAKTQVVENGSAKVLPFSSKNLIVNSTL